jgi:hypothetical protein
MKINGEKLNDTWNILFSVYVEKSTKRKKNIGGYDI